ncbi:hypothetical protein DL766_000627 [Monosporascus sp. MC13-8B]|uniref:Uncharacterized protein n=1 Tax=Monosporascus cannonballus TaxID=155416 RepID=A0ABY0H063_9PEZI|nr:hypothetical protein DL762_008397 [Monosporascus cannonballus]RYO80166.1 hypothetical protein DL763_009012 [Monosporascus cannonballus]RYP38987.1 hypothetical protein DL766_000627 [Monosporascus sp. MC13-8B]
MQTVKVPEGTLVCQAEALHSCSCFMLEDLGSPISPAFLPEDDEEFFMHDEDAEDEKYLRHRHSQPGSADLQHILLVYYSEDHMRWSDKRNMWYESAYKSKDKRGITQSIKVYLKDSKTSKTVPTGTDERDVADYSNQTHVSSTHRASIRRPVQSMVVAAYEHLSTQQLPFQKYR